MSLNYAREAWPLDPRRCPCDIHFVDYLVARGVGGRSIFHFGSGVHHLIGLRNLELAEPNDVLAVTASRREHERYVDLIVADPRLARYYKVLFTDIYTLTARQLPRFDLVTLFHLCEYSERSRPYAALDDRALLELLVSRLEAGGSLFLYRRSWAFRQACELLAPLLEAGRLGPGEAFKSLMVHRRPGAIAGQPD